MMEDALAGYNVTTADQPHPDRAGAKMVEMLLSILDGTPAEQLQELWQLVLLPGETSGPCPHRHSLQSLASVYPCPENIRMHLRCIHHAAIICSNYAVSKRFYTECLGLCIIAEHYRAARDSWKLDLALPDGSQIELFSFPNPPARPSYPEACGLRHLAFQVDDVAVCKAELEAAGIEVEPVRVDEYTGRRFVFFADPDGLPLELYEAAGHDGRHD